VHKAHYVLMNIECGKPTIDELENGFKFNDAVLRHLIVHMDEAVSTPSPMMKEEKARSLTERPERPERGERTDRTAEAPQPAPATAQA
jgi:small subunit ribosomal protein S6